VGQDLLFLIGTAKRGGETGCRVLVKGLNLGKSGGQVKKKRNDSGDRCPRGGGAGGGGARQEKTHGGCAEADDGTNLFRGAEGKTSWTLGRRRQEKLKNQVAELADRYKVEEEGWN